MVLLGLEKMGGKIVILFLNGTKDTKIRFLGIFLKQKQVVVLNFLR
jgi:hypothetical protein